MAVFESRKRKKGRKDGCLVFERVSMRLGHDDGHVACRKRIAGRTMMD